MSPETQNLIAVGVAVVAALWAAKMLLSPFLASLRPPKNGGGCAGGCGCGHEKNVVEPGACSSDKKLNP